MTEVQESGGRGSKAAYSIDEFGAEHGIGKSTVYAEIASGRLRAKKVGRRTIILADDAASWRTSLPDGKAAA